MNYLTELNKMFAYCMSKRLSKSEIALLHALYMINNANDWDVWFEADNEFIQRLTGGYSRETIKEARNKLKQKGRIDFVEGKKSIRSPRYKIISFMAVSDKEVDILPDKGVDKEVDILPDIEVDYISKLNQTKPNKTNKKENIKEKNGRFAPPTVDEVREYCKERKNNVDAENFIDFYSAKNWFIGKSKMSDWKAAVRTWERNNHNNGTNAIQQEKEQTEADKLYKQQYESYLAAKHKYLDSGGLKFPYFNEWISDNQEASNE